MHFQPYVIELEKAVFIYSQIYLVLQIYLIYTGIPDACYLPQACMKNSLNTASCLFYLQVVHSFLAAKLDIVLLDI